MVTKETVVNNQVGLHARPATFFIQKANEFKSSVWVEKEERRVNAKSLLGVLSLFISLITSTIFPATSHTGTFGLILRSLLSFLKQHSPYFLPLSSARI